MTGWLAGLLLLSSCHANSNEELLQADMEDISHRVVYVNTFGTWREKRSEGFFRVILLESSQIPPHSKIYIQWIESPQGNEQQDGKITATTPVREINNAQVFNLSAPTISNQDSAAAIALKATNQYTQQVQHVQIVPGNVGQYTLNYTSGLDVEVVEKAVRKIPAALDYYVRPTF